MEENKVILPIIGAIAAIIAVVVVLLRPKKEVPKYPAMGVNLTGLLVSPALITVLVSSLIIGRVHLTQTPPQPIIIQHKQLTEHIPVPYWI